MSCNPAMKSPTIPLVARFVLLDKVSIDSGQKAVGTVGIALVGFIAFVSTVQKKTTTASF